MEIGGNSSDSRATPEPPARLPRPSRENQRNGRKSIELGKSARIQQIHAILKVHEFNQKYEKIKKKHLNFNKSLKIKKTFTPDKSVKKKNRNRQTLQKHSKSAKLMKFRKQQNKQKITKC